MSEEEETSGRIFRKTMRLETEKQILRSTTRLQKVSACTILRG
jgi:hypothetical protein